MGPVLVNLLRVPAAGVVLRVAGALPRVQRLQLAGIMFDVVLLPGRLPVEPVRDEGSVLGEGGVVEDPGPGQGRVVAAAKVEVAAGLLR